ncbi:helix-turn-helix domain-containing protein [Pseudomonas sp.]|uniref:helix-turn-helix domain-containing protein n=1 Tax=Pseudomonas sp. TaxID=306 RepID=UPI003FD79B31
MDSQALNNELGIAPRTARTWRKLNRHGFSELTIKIGRRVFYRRAELMTWIETQKCKP